MKPRFNPFLVTSAAILAIATCTHAVDYTWDGGTGNWNATNWNGATTSGPTSAGNTAIINSGTVTANVGGPGNLDSIIIGSGGQLNLYNGDGGIYAYQGIGNLNLQGGIVNGGSATYHAYGASLLGNVTVSGSAASTIQSGSWFNIYPTTTFTVADATGNSNTDLLVTTSLRALPDGGNDWAYSVAAIIKEGAGTMEVTQHSYFRGGLTLNGGTLKVSGGNGGYGHFAGVVTVNSGTTLETVSDGTGLGWQNDWKPTSVNINGGTITTAGTSHIWGISGGINMTGGTLQSNNGVSDANGPQLEWNYTDVNTNASAGTATIGGRIRIRGDGGYAGITFNVANGAAATDLLVSAAITEASGGRSITKTGDGNMVLSGANNYTGATTVSGGKLIVNGNISTSNTTVQAGATLGGSGTVGAVTVQTNGIFSPGNSPGTLTFTGDLTLNSGSISNFEINSFSLGNYDLAIAAASGTQNVSFNGILNLLFQSGFNTIGSIKIFDFDGYSGVFTSVVPTGLADGFSASFDTATGIVTVVPEPAAALLGGLGMLALLRRRRA